MGAPPFSRSVERPQDVERRSNDSFAYYAQTPSTTSVAAGATEFITDFGATDTAGDYLVGLVVEVDGTVATSANIHGEARTRFDDASTKMRAGWVAPNHPIQFTHDVPVPTNGDVAVEVTNDGSSSVDVTLYALFQKNP